MVFTNTTVANPEVTWSFWTFGDGGSSGDENPTHIYDEEGTYTVTLFVANDTYAPGNVWDIYQDTVEVLPAGCVPVRGADFSHVENPPLVVRFSGTVIPGMASLPITYTWDFGDGNVGSGQVVTHTYELSSTTSYTVTMTASNACPSQSMIQKLITLWPRTIYLPTVMRNY
jgi:PKD repeat protein